MAGAGKTQLFHSGVMLQQEKDMRRLELGEALAKDDEERAREITKEMAAHGVIGIPNEMYRAEVAFAEFEEREAKRQAEQALFEPVPATPPRDPERDPPLQPQQDPARQAAQDPVREADPNHEAERAPEGKPAFTYADLKTEHAAGVVKTEGQEQASLGDKRLRFYEDREQEPARDKAEKDRDARDQDQRAPGEKQLRFFEHKNPTHDHSRAH
jgi:hypothetical protein